MSLIAIILVIVLAGSIIAMYLIAYYAPWIRLKKKLKKVEKTNNFDFKRRTKGGPRNQFMS